MTVRGIIALICVFVVVPFLIWQFAMDNRGTIQTKCENNIVWQKIGTQDYWTSTNHRCIKDEK